MELRHRFKTLLHPEFYCNVVYKLSKIVSSENASNSFIKCIKKRSCQKRIIAYNIWHCTADLVVDPFTVNGELLYFSMVRILINCMGLLDNRHLKPQTERRRPDFVPLGFLVAFHIVIFSLKTFQPLGSLMVPP